MKTKTKLSLNRETVLNLTIQPANQIKGGKRDTNEQCPMEMTDVCHSEFVC